MITMIKLIIIKIIIIIIITTIIIIKKAITIIIKLYALITEYSLTILLTLRP